MDWIQEELETLDAQGLRRSLRTIDGAPQAHFVREGKSYVNFSSNNYLGLATHPRVLQAAKKALDRYGAGASASRLLCGTLEVHTALEKALADFKGTEAALVFPSGYMANLGLVTALVGPGDAVVLDRLCHASLVDAVRLSRAKLLVYAHADAHHAEHVLKRLRGFRRRLIVTDSLFSMDGDFAPLTDLVALAQRYEAMLLIDEAHAIGVWGEKGRGATELFGVENRVPFVMGTLSKALGSQGGFVCGSRSMIDFLVNRARSFIYTTGLSPAAAAASREALRLIQEEPERRAHAQALAKRLREKLKASGWNILKSESQIVPILLGSVEQAAAFSNQLLEAGIYAPAIRPPTVPQDQCRIRFSVAADHSEEDIDRLVKALKSLFPSPCPLPQGERNFLKPIPRPLGERAG